MGHKISVGLLGSHCPFKAQCEGMHVLHFGTMSLINNCKPNLGHFHRNPFVGITKDKTIIIMQYLHIGHENRCLFWEPQTILNMVV
jgi:hypothetical protein